VLLTFIWSFLSSKLLTEHAANALLGPVMAVTGATKDATSIRRDIVETKIAQHKLSEVENLVSKASLDDVKDYDPKTRKIIAMASNAGGMGRAAGSQVWILKNLIREMNRRQRRERLAWIGLLRLHLGPPSVLAG
jgi:hypothetical protein